MHGYHQPKPERPLDETETAIQTYLLNQFGIMQNRYGRLKSQRQLAQIYFNALKKWNRSGFGGKVV